MFQRFFFWPLFAAIMGFAMGGSVAWGIMYEPPQYHAADNHQANDHPAQKENKNGFWEKAGDDPIAYFTLWLVGFTGVLAVSTIGLWIVTWRASVSQARDMTASIDAARRSADTAERSMTSIQRAFVFTDIYNLNQIEGPSPERPFYFSNVWKNSGASRTVRGRSHSSWTAFGSPIPDDFNFPDLGDAGRPTQFLIGPGGTIIGHRLEIDHKYFASAMEGITHLYVWGWCEYNDIFPNTPRHRTEFCVKIERVGEPFDVNEPGRRGANVEFAHHYKHNGADEDCLKPVQS